ncbi:MAG: omptin family plasminogen activator Pla [Thiohalomonadaceae bacterium]
MNRTSLQTGILALMLCGLSLGAAAQTVAISDDGMTQISLKAGMMSGESGEYVYDADGSASGIRGYKISELQWELDNVWMAGINLRHRFSEGFALGVDYWANAGDGDGYMTDYDWLYIGLDWSHRSQHPDTTVRDANRIDINGEFLLHRNANERFDVYALLGYRRDHFDWQARGGTAIYSNVTYRDTYLVFADVPVISYEQTWEVPYLGLGLRSTSLVSGRRVTADLSARYSVWAQGEDIDIHHLRDLRFEESGKDGQWLDLQLNVDVALDTNLDLTFGIAHTAYSEVKGPTTVTDLTTGATSYYPGDAAGLDHSSTLLSLGLNYRM